ncbi:MAG: efflux RND transporter periplasmic adaptor subunit [Bacteroidota bacterium]
MKHLKSILLIGGIVVGGIGIAAMLVAFSPEPPRETPMAQAPLVYTTDVAAQSGQLRVTGTGTVQPTREVSLSAEVAGRLVSVSPSLVTGGIVRAGQVLATIDRSDYENAVVIAEAQVTQRRVEVAQAEEEVKLAQAEWARLNTLTGETSMPDSSDLGRLAFREPQLQLSIASLRSAEAQLADAQARLARTQIKAPFSGRIRSKLVDLGQYVAPGQAVASIYATDEVEVVVPLSSREADQIEGLWSRSGKRLAATVTTPTNGAQWDGYVHRAEGAKDPATRQVNLVVRVPRPYVSRADRSPLLVGSFAVVSMPGTALERYFDVPRAALRDGTQVWSVADGRLAMHPVTVVQEVEDRVVLTAPNLPDTFALVLSDLAVVTDGMAVRAATR